MVKDRFKKLSHNYAEYFGEVFEKQGFSYRDFQKSIFNAVSENFSNFKNAQILDIGCGDGESLVPFVKAGCTNLTGIDLNEIMLESARKRLGKNTKLMRLDATKMSIFSSEQFDIIVTGACIHNIPKLEREKFWNELLRLNPKIFVAAEKIADQNQTRHKESYDREVKAILEVYGDKHNLSDVAQEWTNHYKYDEKEKLTLDEIKDFLDSRYRVKIVYEVGMYKTVVALRKK